MVKTLFLTAVLLAPSLAYGDASVPLSISVIPASATCQSGNHGLVRGRPKIARGTLVADDGCLLVGGGGINLYTGGNFTSTDGYNDLASWQATHDIKHFNASHWYADLLTTQVGAPSYYHDINYWNSYYDTVVSNANQTGMYVVITCDNKIDTVNNSGGTDWSNCNTFWQTIAARYANNTNVVYEVANEPDLGSNYVGPEDTAYNIIRSAAPNTPILTFSFCCFGSVGTVQSLPDINYANAAVAYHLYGNAGLDSALQSDGYPVIMTEYGPCGTNFPQCDTNILNTLNKNISAFNLSDPQGFAINWPKD